MNKAKIKYDDYFTKTNEIKISNNVKEIVVDVVVVGSGGGGLIAAINAKTSGANVIVLEKLPIIGGNTLISGGEYAAPENWLQKKEGITDSIDLFKSDVQKSGGNIELIDVLSKNALEGAIWLRDFVGVEWIDELMYFGGHSVKRSLIPKGQSGKELINKLQNKTSEMGIEIITEANVYELIFDENTVKGVKAKTKDGILTVRAKSVILATGGYGANKKMLYENDSEIDEKILSTNSTGSMGDGIRLAQSVGADVIDMDKIQLYPVCDVKTGNLLYTGDTRLTSGAILINKEGKRFVEELDTRRAISLAIKKQIGNIAYQLWDSESTKKSEILEHHSLEAEKLQKDGNMIVANSIDEVADFFKIEKGNLKETVEKFNKDSEQGKDTEYNLRRLGFKIDKPPFYCIKCIPAVHHTMGGIKINKNAEVLDKNNQVITGLYAVGEVTGGIHGNNRFTSRHRNLFIKTVLMRLQKRCLWIFFTRRTFIYTP